MVLLFVNIVGNNEDNTFTKASLSNSAMKDGKDNFGQLLQVQKVILTQSLGSNLVEKC